MRQPAPDENFVKSTVTGPDAAGCRQAHSIVARSRQLLGNVYRRQTRIAMGTNKLCLIVQFIIHIQLTSTRKFYANKPLTPTVATGIEEWSGLARYLIKNSDSSLYIHNRQIATAQSTSFLQAKLPAESTCPYPTKEAMVRRKMAYGPVQVNQLCFLGMIFPSIILFWLVPATMWA